MIEPQFVGREHEFKRLQSLQRAKTARLVVNGKGPLVESMLRQGFLKNLSYLRLTVQYSNSH